MTARLAKTLAFAALYLVAQLAALHVLANTLVAWLVWRP